jgi:hypothetical protein
VKISIDGFAGSAFGSLLEERQTQLDLLRLLITYASGARDGDRDAQAPLILSHILEKLRNDHALDLQSADLARIFRSADPTQNAVAVSTSRLNRILEAFTEAATGAGIEIPFRLTFSSETGNDSRPIVRARFYANET